MLIKLTIRRSDGSGSLVYQGLVNTLQLNPDRPTILDIAVRRGDGPDEDRVGVYIPWAALAPSGHIVMGEGILIELIEVLEPKPDEGE